MAAVVVEDDVDDLAGRDFSLDRVQKTDEFLMPVALHAATDNRAIEHSSAATGSSCHCVYSRGSWCHTGRASSGSPGWVPSSAWICDFSSTLSTIACAGGSM